MSYLARLKRLESERNFTHTPETLLTKPTQPGSVSCVSALQGCIEKINVANVGAKTTSTAAEQMEVSVILDADIDLDNFVDRSIDIAEPPDDRRTCMQCLNLHGRICSIAGPGKLVSARHGYQPMRDVLHRCAGYQANNQTWVHA